MNMKKILVTLGPSSLKNNIIEEMTKYGIYLFRINLSHTKLENVEDCINIIKQSTDVSICLDSEGAQIRNQQVKNGKIIFSRDNVVKIHHDEVLGDESNMSFSPEGVAKQFIIGDIINVDFDLVSFEIIETHRTYCLAKVVKGGAVESNKAADIQRELMLPGITDKDKKAFRIGKKMGVRHFALSFASSKQDVLSFRDIVGSDSRIISKIESKQGLLNLKTIIKYSDELLIDRGDLSRQVPIEKVPFFQRRIISICRLYDKPIYVATNLLESMLKVEVPNRAEVNDVVSTLLMGADGLVLAAETAVGRFPVQSVRVIRNLCLCCKRWTPNTSINEILEM
jgi:pyruvate kinase